MSNELDNWPGSTIDKVMTAESVGKFLRTHRDGERLLWEWLQSLPPDRTEEEYAQECQEAQARHEAFIRANIEEYNARRKAQGLGPVDRQLNVICGPGAPRNRKQTERARADRKEIVRLLERKPQPTAKQILRILGWPLSKLRAVERHMRAIRNP